MKLNLLLIASWLAFASHASTSGFVRIVNTNGTQSFPDIASAVDNDVILVVKGNYGGFTIPATLSLSIIDAPQGAIVTINGTIKARPTAQDSVVLSGFTVYGPYGTSVGLDLNSASGPVRVQDCSFLGSTGIPYQTGGAFSGALLTSCAQVGFERCSSSAASATSTTPKARTVHLESGLTLLPRASATVSSPADVAVAARTTAAKAGADCAPRMLRMSSSSDPHRRVVSEAVERAATCTSAAAAATEFSSSRIRRPVCWTAR